MLRAEKIRERLTEPDISLEILEKASSTNTLLKERAMAGQKEGAVLIAREQTGGRGRRGRSFLSSPDKGLYMSVLLRPGLPAEKLMPLTGMCAVAAAEAAQTVSGRQVGVKWVNDLILNGKKLGGILTELGAAPGENTPWAVVGIGVNLGFTEEDFRAAELSGIATSFLAEGGNVEGEALAGELINAFFKMEKALRAGEIARYLSSYRERCVTLHRPVKILYPSGAREGTALDIDESFSLRVRRTDDNTEDTVFSGEVSVRGFYGYI